MQNSIELNGVGKRFDSVAVLSDISLRIAHGERMLLLGRNGSGKSTLLRICAGLLRPDHGKISFNGAPAQKSSTTSVGYFGHHSLLYGQLSVRENLRLFFDLMASTLDLEEILRKWNLSSFGDRKISDLSKGMVARVSLCRALFHDPLYAFLDEPTSSLDDATTTLMLENIFNSAKHQCCALIATHDVARLRSSATGALLLENGMVIGDSRVVSGGVEEVLDQYRRKNR